MKTPETTWLPPSLAYLPRVLRDLVDDVSTVAKVDPALCLLPAIAAASGAIGKSYRLKIHGTWSEWPTLWCALIARPGSGKTPSARPAIEPLRSIERSFGDEHQQRLVQFEEQMARWRALDKKERDNTKPPVRPASRRILVEDTTMEALARTLKENPVGVMMYRDELAGLIGGLDRYAKNGNGSDEAKLNSLWSSEMMIVDRKSEPDPTRVDGPFMAVAGNLTPGGLEMMAGGRTESGLFARFLIAWPPQDAREFPSDYEPEEPASLERWRQTLVRLAHHARDAGLEMEDMATGARSVVGGPTVREVSLGEDSRRQFFHFVNETEQMTAVIDPNNPACYACAKMASQAARLALVFHALEHPESREIGPRTMYWAVNWGRWFRAEAQRIASHQKKNDDADWMDAMVEWMAYEPDGVTARDLMRSGPRPRPKSAKEAKEKMQAMVASGLAVPDGNKLMLADSANPTPYGQYAGEPF